MTNSGESPTLSKAALLTLVEWVKKYHNRSTYIEIHAMGEHSHRESSAPNKFIRNNVIEKTTKFDNKHGERQ
ncbi:hypothetical protein [Candidatus Tisiphia endosymbiont of Ditula angustiorana]|uniref:hypothetical protein n=1 Tax=Candidatus Tisiphia endosymbiont of Ditula angustiorana TaxID=3066272 RepID=UPI00312C7A85